MCLLKINKNVHTTDSKKHMSDLVMFCKKIEPFVLYYKRLIKLYNNTTYSILKNEIKIILPQIPTKQNVELSPHWYPDL